LGLKKVKADEERREKKIFDFCWTLLSFYSGFLGGWDCLVEFRVVDGELVRIVVHAKRVANFGVYGRVFSMDIGLLERCGRVLQVCLGRSVILSFECIDMSVSANKLDTLSIWTL